MLKRLLASTLAIAATLAIGSSAYAADVYETIEVTAGQYPNINFQPRTLHVNDGDTLHLTVRNTREGSTRFFMPAFNIDQEIPFGNVAQFDICVSNPLSKVMWFNVSALDGEKIPGYLVTTNYQVPIVQTPAKFIDTSALNDIINYSKDYCYAEKQEPKYGAPRRNVRGYW